MGDNQLGYFPNTDNQNGAEKNTAPLSYHEMCNNLFADYLAMGMSSKEYWDGDPKLVIAYRKAYRMKRKNRNYDLWLQGLYFYEALVDASPAFRDLTKTNTPRPYPDKPYCLDDEEKRKRAETEEEQRDLKNQAYVKAWAERVNRLKAQKAKQEEKKEKGEGDNG